MAQMEYCGTTSFFIRTLLDKKYALPYRVVDALVDHFLRFRTEERQLPVVWQQTLLCFVQRCVRPGGLGSLGRQQTLLRLYASLHCHRAHCVLPSLLCPQFCRYKTEVRREDKEALRDLVKRQHHYALTPEILREIDSSRSRGEQPAPGEAGAAAGGALGGGGGQQMARKVAGVGHGGTAENPRDLAPIIMMDE